MSEGFNIDKEKELESRYPSRKKEIEHEFNVRKEIEEMDKEDSAQKKGFMDIRFFLGLLLGIYGVILTIFGLLRPELATFVKGIDFNLNLWWGLLFLVVGILFFIFSKKPSEWAK